jgi:hypothetical protein
LKFAYDRSCEEEDNDFAYNDVGKYRIKDDSYGDMWNSYYCRVESDILDMDEDVITSLDYADDDGGKSDDEEDERIEVMRCGICGDCGICEESDDDE